MCSLKEELKSFLNVPSKTILYHELKLYLERKCKVLIDRSLCPKKTKWYCSKCYISFCKIGLCNIAYHNLCMNLIIE